MNCTTYLRIVTVSCMNLFHSSFYVFIGQQASVPAQQGSTHGNDMHHLNYFSHY